MRHQDRHTVGAACLRCGDEALNDFPRRYARQQPARDFSRTYVVLADDAVTVTAFVSVSAGQVGTASFPARLKLTRYPVPVLRIGRLAFDRRAQGGKICVAELHAM